MTSIFSTVTVIILAILSVLAFIFLGQIIQNGMNDRICKKFGYEKASDSFGGSFKNFPQLECDGEFYLERICLYDSEADKWGEINAKKVCTWRKRQ